MQDWPTNVQREKHKARLDVEDSLLLRLGWGCTLKPCLCNSNFHLLC